MSFSVTCPGCKGVNSHEDPVAGKQVNCQFCGALIDVPIQSSMTSEQISETATPSPPGKAFSRPMSQPVDDLNDFPRTRHLATFERHRRESSKVTADQEPGNPSFDPVQWSPVRKGLAMVLCGWAAILVVSGLFTAYWLWTFFFFKIDPQEDGVLPAPGQFWLYSIYLFKNDVAWIRTVVVTAGWIALVGALLSFAGQCFCITVPTVSRARGLVIASVLGSLVTLLSIGGLFFVGIGNVLEPLDNQKIEADKAPPKEEAPKAEPPPPGDEAPKVEAPMPAEAAPAPTPPFPGVKVPMLPKLLILGAYLASQTLFVLFLKRAALYCHDVFLADSTGAYLALLFFHTLLVALLPLTVMIACFFWVVMLGLQYLLMAWLLVLVAGTRKAIG